MADEIRISIVATDGATKVFEDLTASAEKLEDAFTPIDGRGMKDLREEAMTLAPELDKVRDSGRSASDSLSTIPTTVHDVGNSASDAKQPLGELTSSVELFGQGIKEVGEYLPGTLGDVATGVGELALNFDTIEAAMGKAGTYAKAAIASIGPVGVAAALGIAGIAALNFAGVLGDNDGLSQRIDDIRAASDAASESINKVAFAMDDAAAGLELFQASAELGQTVDDLTRLYELDRVLKGEDPLGTYVAEGIPGVESYNAAIAEAIQLAEKYNLNREDELNYLPELGNRVETLAEKQELFNSILSHTGPGAADARDRLLELNTQFINGEISLEDYNWNLQWINDNLVVHYDLLAAAEAAQRQYAEAAFAAAESVGLLDTALEQMNAAGLLTDATMVALNLSTSALDSTFGTIVGTTNQLAAGSQAVADWINGLTETEDGMSKVAQLYEDGRISLDEYGDALGSAVRINEANNDIQQEVLAIQTKHAPLLADLTEKQRDYIESLGDLSAEQQLAALGFMDSAQSAKAMELAYLAADAASGALGDTGTETATKIIEAAANADPVMRQMLIDMGLISEGAEGEVKVNFPNASSLTTSVDNLTLSIDALTIALGGIPPSVTTTVSVVDESSYVIANVKAALEDLDGTTSTVYVNTVGGGLTLGEGYRNGGVVGYANGGMVLAELGENGPELLRLANGGVALAPTRGLYMVEPGSNVMPAEATRAELQRRRSPSGQTIIYSGQVTQQVTYDASSFAIRRSAIAGSRR